MLNYLLELRRRALYIVVLFFALFLLFFFYAHHLFYFFILPLLNALPTNEPLIATHITSPLLTPLKLAANTALLLTAPFILFQIWCFASPGLYRRERENLRWVLVLSLLLFCLGVSFCFYVVLPIILTFFANTVPEGVRMMPDMAYAVDFITRMLLIFGFCFQVPLLCVLLVKMQWLSIATLKTVRPYMIVAAFVIAMLLTPPDVVSQVLLAVPLCLLYEVGIVLASCNGATIVKE